jgi:YVTN family beta-propeller protein
LPPKAVFSNSLLIEKNMKTKIINLAIVVAALVGIMFLLPGKNISPGKTGRTLENKIYVAVEESGEIAIVSEKQRKVIRKIDLTLEVGEEKVAYMPHNVEVAPDNKSVWITANAMDMDSHKTSFLEIPKAHAHGDDSEEEMNASDQVIVIDPLTDKIVRRIDIGPGLHLAHVSLTPDSKYAIVTAQEGGIIYRINAQDYKIEKETKTEPGAEPHGLRISPDGKTAYVAILKGKGLGILDIGNMGLSVIPLKGSAVQAGVTPDGKYALASIYDTKSLAIYDIASKNISYVELPVEAKGPVQIYPTPDSKYTYVADQGYYFNEPISDMVYKIDLEGLKVLESIKAGKGPHGIAVSRDGDFAYVTNLLSGDLSVIDTAQGKEAARIKVGEMPNGVSIFYADGISATQKPAKTGYLEARESKFDFGTVSMAKGKVKHSFSMKNTGKDPVNIAKIYTSCMCTEATIVSGDSRMGPFGMPGHGGSSMADKSLMPGESMDIEVQVDPAAHGPGGTGKARKIVYIETNSEKSPTIKLVLDIDVTP